MKFDFNPVIEARVLWENSTQVLRSRTTEVFRTKAHLWLGSVLNEVEVVSQTPECELSVADSKGDISGDKSGADRESVFRHESDDDDDKELQIKSAQRLYCVRPPGVKPK